MPFQLYTIGHSTHSLDQFLALLGRRQIEVVADIRRFPGSRKFPHFNRESLAAALPEGSDRHELTIARRFFANATDAERDLIAYWQMVKLVEEAHLRYKRGRDA